MNEQTLYLGWRDNERQRWFPIGRLDAETDLPRFRFRYTAGAERASREVRFPPLYDFPDMKGDYQSTELFAIFRNRVIARGRADREQYLDCLDLPKDADSVEILSVSGGRRVTDFYEVFPKIEKDKNGRFTCRFLLGGLRDASASTLQRIDQLKKGEELHIVLEQNSLTDWSAVQIQTQDDYTIGWVPRYLMGDMLAAMAESPTYSAHVVKVNPQPAPRSQRVLIEMCGRWAKHEPMSGQDFVPIVDAENAP